MCTAGAGRKCAMLDRRWAALVLVPLLLLLLVCVVAPTSAGPAPGPLGQVLAAPAAGAAMPGNALKASESLSSRVCIGEGCDVGSRAALLVLWGLMNAVVLLLLFRL